jgi:hypothetical protein
MGGDNLAIWGQVEKTDPEFTKEFRGAGGFSGTAIKPTYLIRKATEIFGPIGIGWGYEVIEERYDKGAPLGVNADGVEVCSLIHTIRLMLWYKPSESSERGEITHYGHTPYVYANKNGFQTDPEVGKKSLTDAIGKCLSMLGFAADIHMGQFDDINYLQELRNEFAIEKADDKVDAKLKQDEAYRSWVKDNLKLIEEAINDEMLKGVYISAIRKAKNRNDNEVMLKLEKAKDKRKAELEEAVK